MSPQWISLYIFVIAQSMIKVQTEERYYFNAFNTTMPGWTVDDEGKYNGGGIDYGIVNNRCVDPMSRCCRIMGGSAISRSIPTSGYHAIRIMIDVNEYGLDSGEWCYLQYKTNLTSWTTVNLITIYGNVFDKQTIIPDNSSYNDQETFRLRLGNGADLSTDYCYFDNLQVYGTSLTQSPTKHPTITPSVNPTESTNDPTLAPTKNPTTYPTTYPTKHPTSYSSKTPTDNPTTYPIKHPTSSPSNNPTKNTINSVTSSSAVFTSELSHNINTTLTTTNINSIGCLPTNICLNNGWMDNNFGPAINSQIYVCNNDGTITHLIYTVGNCEGQAIDSVTGYPDDFDTAYTCSKCDDYIKYKYWDIISYDDADCTTKDSVDWYELIEPIGDTNYGLNTCTDEEITIHSMKMKNGCNLNNVTSLGKTIERWMQIEIQYCPGYEIKINDVIETDGSEQSKINSVNYPLVICISAVFLLISLGCCLFSLLRKPSETITKYLIFFARAIVVGSLLAEDIFALLWQDPNSDDRNIFWIFYGFSCLVGMIESYTLPCKSVDGGWTALIFVILIEITQSILFMWICNWTFLSVYGFSVFCIVQILLECVIFFCERSSNPASDAKIEQGITTAAVKCWVAIIAGIGVMPFVYYGEETPFRSQWFDIFVTTTIWFSILSGTIMAHTSLNPKIYDIVIVCIICVGLTTLGVVWVLSIIYLIKLQEWQPGFEYGYTMFMVVMGPTCICGFPCCVARLYSKMQDRLAKQLNDAMNPNTAH